MKIEGREAKAISVPSVGRFELNLPASGNEEISRLLFQSLEMSARQNRFSLALISKEGSIAEQRNL
jgi:hypothetical protein